MILENARLCLGRGNVERVRRWWEWLFIACLRIRNAGDRGGGVCAAERVASGKMQVDATKSVSPKSLWRRHECALGVAKQWVDDHWVAVFGTYNPRVYGGFVGDGRGGVHSRYSRCGVCCGSPHVGGDAGGPGGDYVPRFTAEFLAEERRALGQEAFSREYGCEFADVDSGVFQMPLVVKALREDVTPLFERNDSDRALP